MINLIYIYIYPKMTKKSKPSDRARPIVKGRGEVGGGSGVCGRILEVWEWMYYY